MSDTDSEPEQILEKKPTKAKKAQVKKAVPPPDAPAPVEAVEALEKPKRVFTEKQKEALAAARLKRKLARDAEAVPVPEPEPVVKPKRAYKKKVVLAEPEPEPKPPKPKRVSKKAAPVAPAYYPIEFV
jgi:hypothetical protein